MSAPRLSPSESLSIAEAAEFLGVSVSTLRNWDKSGKLKPRRHPLNKYRIYSREDLQAIHFGDGVGGSRKGMFPPQFDWEEIDEREHFVQFYESDRHLVHSVVGFAAPSLCSEGAFVLIATPPHREAIERELLVRGCDVAAARERGQYVALDAAETLAKLMNGNLPDTARFMQVVGGVVSRLGQSWPRVRAFGEMVALLWEAGNRAAATRLEELWSELAKERAFSLFCAYPLDLFSGSGDAQPFHEVCACHTKVVPGESYSQLSTPDEQFREISALQQKAKALEKEIALREQAESELTDFVENALEGLHKLGSDGTILWANKAELEMLGYEEAEYVGHHIAEFHARRDSAGHIMAMLLAGRHVFNYPVELRRKDGSLRHVLIHANGYYDQGRLLFVRCFTRDVTENKRAERDRAWLAAIVDSSDDAIVSKDLKGTITSWNRAAERLFGYSAEEAIGQSVTMLIPQDRADEEPEILSRIHRGERVEHCETVRRRQNGTLVEVSLTVSPIVDGLGRVIGASKIARDITERREAENRHRRSEERYRQLAELMPVAVYTCDASGKITYYNRHAEILWGRAPQLGHDGERFCGSLRLWHPDGSLLPHAECPMALAIRQGQSFQNQEVVVEQPDGSRLHVVVNIAALRDASGEVIGAINAFSDMTPLKRAEAALREGARKKDEFLATMAHELRNPLAPIKHSLQLLQLTGNIDTEVREMHLVIERQVTHMVRLIDDLLEISRINRGSIELRKTQIELETIIAQALEASKPLYLSAGHQVNVSFPQNPIVVEGDSIRLVQVFTNLLNNAAKYSDNGSTVEVRVNRDLKGARISIKDSGIGIQPEMIPRLFAMFSQIPNTLSRSQGGLGIGLHLVKTLVELHGGSVEAYSEGIGQGSEFVVWLPESFKVNGSPRRMADPVPSPGESKELSHRVLLVDDNRDSANSLARLLKRGRMDVHVVYDGHSALDAVRIFRPSVVVLDIGLPDISGYEVARHLRSDPAHQDLLLIAISGWGQMQDISESKDAGIDHHLVKPVEFDELVSLLAHRTTDRLGSSELIA
jgi:PAS domain S-box-containing protein